MKLPSIITFYCVIVVATAVPFVLSGCNSRSRTSYASTCKDGFESRANTTQGALDGCLTHGGALSSTPRTITERRPSTSTTSSRRNRNRSRRNR